MNRLLALVLVPVIVVLPGCGALALQGQNSRLDQVIADLQEVKQIEAKARKDADTDGDGKLSISEMVAYGGLVSAGLVELARRKQGKALAERHDESAEDRTAMQKELEDLRRREDVRIAVERMKAQA